MPPRGAERSAGDCVGGCGAGPDGGQLVKVIVHAGSAVIRQTLPANLHVWALLCLVAEATGWACHEVHLAMDGSAIRAAKHLIDLVGGNMTEQIVLTARRVRAPRAYIVWVQPEHPEDTGIWLGGGAAWAALERRLPGSRYSYASGVRQRSVDAGSSPMTEWGSEVERHGSQLEPTLHWATP